MDFLYSIYYRDNLKSHDLTVNYCLQKSLQSEAQAYCHYFKLEMVKYRECTD